MDKIKHTTSSWLPQKAKEYNQEWRREHPNYSREWYEKNLEKVKEASRKWYENSLEKVKEYGRKYYKENREERKEYGRKYHKEHREEGQEYNRKWRKENSERIKEYTREWYKENSEKAKKSARDWYKENLEEAKESHRNWRKENLGRLKESGRSWRKENPEFGREWREGWKRDHPDTTAGRYYGALALKTGQYIYGANKRSYPISGACELCGKIPAKTAKRKLVYHHWNDEKAAWGLWVCYGRYSCHGIAEFSDFYPNLLALCAKYLALKKTDRSKEKRRKRSVSSKTGNGMLWRYARIYPATDRCELCGRTREETRPKKNLVYHHWADDNPMKALWICGFAFRCHDIAEICDQFPARFALGPRYLKLKKKIEAPALIAGKNEKEI